MRDKSKKYPAVILLGVLPIGLLLVVCLIPFTAYAQKEVTSDIPRFRGREMTARSYETYEARPRTHLPVAEGLFYRRSLVTVAPTAERVRIRKYLPDAHLGLRFYYRRKCIDCHPQQAKDLHRIRERIVCRQCHGPEPIAGILHYYSSMNPRRRFAYICGKCHEKASASFAEYIIHPPNPMQLSTLKTFPVLFAVFWGMVVLAVGTFAVFLPHTILWGIREFFVKRKQAKRESK